MAGTDKLAKMLESPFGCPVYYFASTEESQLRAAASRVLAALAAAGDDFGEEPTRVDGPVPDIGRAIEAAGMISFSGAPRVVEILLLSPSAMKDKDAEELAALFGDVKNAVLVVTALHKDKKAAASKKAKLLLDAAAKAGLAQELAKPGRRENLAHIQKAAAVLGASFASGAAEALLERAGEDWPLLENETAKLAAVSGYGAITTQTVEKYAVHNIEADVFALARMITAGRRADAYARLAELLAQKHEPVAIAAALTGTYVDMLRVRTGIAARKNVGVIFKEMGYKGNEYRLQKARENAARYSPAALEDCVLCLYQLDRQLKSSAVPDKSILLHAAVGQLMHLAN